jgi:hypothetical protein
MGGSLRYLRVDGLTIFEVTLPLPEVEDHAVPEPEFSVVSL